MRATSVLISAVSVLWDMKESKGYLLKMGNLMKLSDAKMSVFVEEQRNGVRDLKCRWAFVRVILRCSPKLSF